MDSILEVLEERINKMRITRSLQTGYINVKMTNLLAEHGEVHFYTPATFNPFEDNKKVTFHANEDPFKDARKFKNKYGSVDVAVLSGFEHYFEYRHALMALVPNVRVHGLVVLTGTDSEEAKKAIDDYIAQIDEEAFEVDHYDTFTLIGIES